MKKRQRKCAPVQSSGDTLATTICEQLPVNAPEVAAKLRDLMFDRKKLIDRERAPNDSRLQLLRRREQEKPRSECASRRTTSRQKVCPEFSQLTAVGGATGEWEPPCPVGELASQSIEWNASRSLTS